MLATGQDSKLTVPIPKSFQSGSQRRLSWYLARSCGVEKTALQASQRHFLHLNMATAENWARHDSALEAPSCPMILEPALQLPRHRTTTFQAQRLDMPWP